MKLLNLFCLIVVALTNFCFVNRVNAAEVLQIRDSITLLIGDHNRIYTVELACVETYPSKEEEATNVLKSELRRKRKVNIRPLGSRDGTLLARVTPINTNKEIGEMISEKGLGSYKC